MQIAIFCLLTLLFTGQIVNGRIQRQRIIGGSVVKIKNFPFMACLLIKSQMLVEPELFAGGSSIISSQWVITAAHCVDDFKDTFIAFGHFYVRSNATVWNDPADYYIDHMVTKAYVHSGYSNTTNDFDVALLKVKEPFTGLYEIPIKLATVDYKYKIGSPAVVLGWGTTEVNHDPFTVPDLRAVEVNLIDHEICVQKFRSAHEYVSPHMMCAGALGRDACVDDSGGPLTQQKTLIGIVSWGIGCASAEHPGVYTNVSHVLDFIQAYWKKDTPASSEK